MNKLMRTLSCAVASVSLAGCGTVNTVKWAYGEESCFSEPDFDWWRPAVGVPVIATGVAFDVLTFPVQFAFGVWPWWGDSSIVLNPN